MIKSTRFRWGGQLAKMEEGRSSFKILKYKPIEKRGPSAERRNVLESNLRKCILKYEIREFWLRKGIIGGPL